MSACKARVVLGVPNSRWLGKRSWNVFPYAALILTALLKDEYEFSILDANGLDLSEEAYRSRIRELQPEALLVTGGSVEYHQQAHRAVSLAREACPAVVTVLGGVYPTTLPEAAVAHEDLDWAFMYHAEDRIGAFLRLLLTGQVEAARAFPGVAFRAADGKLVENPLRERIGDIPVQCQPDYSLVDLAPYLRQESLDYQFNSDRLAAFIITSYGCPYDCVFCASRTIAGRKPALRPVADVLGEIGYLTGRYGVGSLIFLDDNLLIPRARFRALLDGLVSRHPGLIWKAASVSAWHLDAELLELMRRSGCVQLTVSVESGSQRVLNEVIGKPLRLETVPPLVAECRRLGIAVGANFVIGTPGETWDEIRETFRFADDCDFDVAHFHVSTPLPRTELHRICMREGYLPKDFSFTDPRFFGFGQGFITTPEFTPFELAVARAFEWDRINFKTPQRVARMARLYQATPEEMTEHRRQTRRRLGLYDASA
ncbi:MAG: B12-binding domain-containing radical SAM protein [Elusimicrobia bacterium]|nr:B12-binding domain-containing radical SAM protein [Elusimicrobiota bacterium]